MKHLIETTDLSSLGTAKYDRLILDSAKNEIVCKEGEYEYVDLGLPSGLKWAKCNVGAETETDYGDYFMWGSTKANTPDECTWAKAPFNGGTWDAWTKYCTNSKYGTVDNKTTLDPEDDAATQIMGDEWRMPTETEIRELSDYTTNEWITNFNDTGVNGWKFTGSNGNSIFIPAAGYCEDGSVYYVGSDGNVWSSSLYASDPSSAWNLYFSPDDYSIDYNSRPNGRSVRGVRK